MRYALTQIDPFDEEFIAAHKWVSETPIMEIYRMREVNAELLEALKRAVVLAELVTIRQIIQAGDHAIKAAKLNPWCINEGLATGDETHSLLFAHAAIIKAESRT
jgi:hypothetical protein